ncbi:MAG: type glutamate--ammonia ligase, partial [Pseudomonadota bacterium]
FAQTTLILICDVMEPMTGQHYSRCPRSIAKAAENYVNSSGVGDTTYFGPEAEFFIFDDVRFEVGMNKGYYYVDSKEGAYNSGTEYPEGNLPGSPDRLRTGHARRNAGGHEGHGHPAGKAPSRSRHRPA